MNYLGRGDDVVKVRLPCKVCGGTVRVMMEDDAGPLRRALLVIRATFRHYMSAH